MDRIANAKALGAKALPKTAPLASSALPNWFRNGVAGKTIVFSGDSTTSNATSAFSEFTNHTPTGEALSGCSVLNYGNNGVSLAVYLANGATYNLAQIVAAAPSLVVFSWGDNDVRLGVTGQAALEGMLDTAVNQLRSALPSCDIILRTPFAFLSDDPGSTGLVNPLASAQAYTTILRKAYQTQIGKWPNVYVWDCQETISGTTCVASTVNTLMTDILHPNATGQVAWAKYLVQNLIGQGIPGTAPIRAGLAKPLDLNHSDAAISALPATPWLFYPRVLEDDRYFTKLTGGPASCTLNGGFIDITTSDPSDAIQFGDIVQCGNLGAFVIPTTFAASKTSATNLRISSLGGSLPNFAGPFTANVVRAKYGDGTYAYDATIHRTYMNDPVKYPVARRVFIYAGNAGTNFIRLSAADTDVFTSSFDAADVLMMPGQAAIPLTAQTSFSAAGGYVQHNPTGSWAALAGRTGWVFGLGTKTNPDIEKAFQPLFHDIVGAVSATTVKRLVSRGGTIKRVACNLGTASSSGVVTLTVTVNATLALTLTWAQAATGAAGTQTFATGSSFVVRPGDVVSYQVTAAGTGAADLSVALDI